MTPPFFFWRLGKTRSAVHGEIKTCTAQPFQNNYQGVIRVIVLNTLVALIVVMTISWLWTLKAITSEKNSLIPKIIFVLCVIGEFAAIIFGVMNDLS